jgi:hypothetical protein
MLRPIRHGLWPLRPAMQRHDPARPAWPDSSRSLTSMDPTAGNLLTLCIKPHPNPTWHQCLTPHSQSPLCRAAPTLTLPLPLPDLAELSCLVGHWPATPGVPAHWTTHVPDAPDNALALTPLSCDRGVVPPPHRTMHAAHLIGSSAPHPVHLMAGSGSINDDLCHCGFVPDNEGDSAQANGDPNT